MTGHNIYTIAFLICFMIGMSFLETDASDQSPMIDTEDLLLETEEADPFPVTLDAYYEVKFVYNLGQPEIIDMFRHRVRLEADYSFFDAFSLKAIMRASYDPSYQDDTGDEYEELVFRDSYLTYNGDNFNVRLGKQQIVWGIADKYRLLDKVNSFDFQKFITEDFGDIRIPMLALQVNFLTEAFGTFEIDILPIFEKTKLAEPGSTFAIGEIPRNVPFREASEPSDVEYGLKWSHFIGSVEFTLNYLYAYEKVPAIEKEITATGLVLREKFFRTSTMGGTMNIPVGNGVIGTELAYTSDFFLGSDDVLQKKGLAKKDFLQLLISLMLDLELADIQFQYYYEQVLNYDNDIIRDGIYYSCSVRFSKNLMDDYLKLSFLAVYGINDDDWYVTPHAEYSFSDSLEIAGGFYLFEGKEDGVFGQFNDQKQVFTKVRYYF